MNLIQKGINTSNCVAAISNDNMLMGLAGFHLNKSSFINISFHSMIKLFGFIKGSIKYVQMSVIFYRNPDHKKQMLMDGIAVGETNRGKGIGRLLFAELEQFAKTNNITSIKLDVIDENPRAKKLYESIGFSPSKYTKVPRCISKIIGVSVVTSMIKNIK